MPNTQVALIGNVTADPVLRFTQKGLPVISFSVAVNEGSKEDPRTSFYDVSAWRSLAQNCTDTLRKGMRVVVIGQLNQQTWETAEGKRSKVQVTAEAVGPDLRFANAHVQAVHDREGNAPPPPPPPHTQGQPADRGQQWEQEAVKASTQQLNQQVWQEAVKAHTTSAEGTAPPFNGEPF